MSLYLKYRPADFKNLVWQSFVKDTLQKAIKDDKTVWAYLFCWPRWTGKTSSARIFAKAINCENPINGNPCLECSICRDFADERLIDIIEIDAASNTWVDNIREIIEKAQFQPSKTKYKIYIIDEVHMLSKWAFNALLKILEEPPSHVKFILATTETHKVPETIISRCQRYDFKRISNNDIKERLEYIANAEWIKIDEKSIEYIIKNSAGWLRNAISLFEQLIFDSELNYENIVKKLEIVDEDIISTFLEKLLNKDSSVIEIFDKNIDDWKNIKLFFKELIYFTKAKTLNEIRLSNDVTKYIEVLDTLDETYSKTRNSLDENTTFLIGILKLLNSYNTKKVVETIQANNIIPAQSNSNNIQQNKVETPVKKVEESSISHDDLSDIFGWEDDVFWENTQNKVEEKSSAWNVNFDLNTFIDKLKKNWAKWWLTMAIRWANVSFNWTNLVIGVHNKISKWQIENVENMNLMTKSLSDMWIENINIKLN